uniref:Uncharacterized protein n=1 Tax=Panagrellus redivivus TaxID=6233 RepID=A0A7E4VD72_PANRE
MEVESSQTMDTFLMAVPHQVLILATIKKTHRQSSTLALVAALRIRRGKQCIQRLKPPQPHALAGATRRGNCQKPRLSRSPDPNWSTATLRTEVTTKWRCGRSDVLPK